MKIVTTYLFLLVAIGGLSQANVFRGTILLQDSFSVQNGLVVFPIIKDTLKIDGSGIAKINLDDPSRRVFYFLWSGWRSKLFQFDKNQCDTVLTSVSIPESLFYKYYYDTKTCPICRSSKYLIPIVYGFPTEKMMRKANKGIIYLGGCIITENNPLFYCKKHEFDF